MMRAWCNILPMFLVRRIAARRGERFRIDGVGIVVQPFRDVIIRVEEPRP